MKWTGIDGVCFRIRRSFHASLGEGLEAHTHFGHGDLPRIKFHRYTIYNPWEIIISVFCLFARNVLFVCESSEIFHCQFPVEIYYWSFSVLE